ncbi:MAG: glycosyltransferase family 4 protein [Candidatus Binatia bacterium]
MLPTLHIVLLNYRDVTHPETGGAEIYLQEIFQRIAAHGHRVTLICSGHRGASAEDEIAGIRILRSGNQATVNIAAARAALRLARRERVDVFVESLCKLPFLMPLFTKIPVLPVVLHLFGHTVFHEANPVLASYVWLYEKLIPPVYRGLRFVALSESTAQDLTRRGVRASQMDIVPPGLDLKPYSAGRAAPAPGQPLLVYVGRLKRYKGLDAVLRAFVRVRTVVPNAQLVVLGKGDDGPRLERLTQRLQLTDAVTFAGFVPEDVKIDWLHRAHALVYPSPREGWGISTIEAAASGTPVLASDAEGLRDAVRDGATGFLIPHGDVDAWARRMLQMLTDAALRQRMSAAAQQWAAQFSWDAAAQKMLQSIEAAAIGTAAQRGAA